MAGFLPGAADERLQLGYFFRIYSFLTGLEGMFPVGFNYCKTVVSTVVRTCNRPLLEPRRPVIHAFS